jgi:hypothetical protein
MFLYEGDCLKNITEIRGIRYVTVSHYSGDTVIQNKMAELIKRDFHPSELNNLTNESSVGLDMAISAQDGYCVSKANEKEDI